VRNYLVVQVAYGQEEVQPAWLEGRPSVEQVECQVDDLVVAQAAASAAPCLAALHALEAAEPSSEGDQAEDREAGQEAVLQALLCS